MVCLGLCAAFLGFMFTETLGQTRTATCNLLPHKDSTQSVTGTVMFTQAGPSDDLHVTILASGFKPLAPGGEPRHGFHVHEFGNVTGQDCLLTGGHYNPTGTLHGAPTNAPEDRHAGDFGNINQTASGNMGVTFSDPVASLYGENAIVGKGIVMHAGVDDLGLGGNEASKKNGNAGPRLACCVITLN